MQGIGRLDKLFFVFSRSYGGIYTENLRGATQFDSYMLRGDPNGEIYEPTYVSLCFLY
jgi:hypothetical protein